MGNCVKRVVVIIAAVIFFQNPVSPINGVGTAVALAGVYGYTRVKRAETAAAKQKAQLVADVGVAETNEEVTGVDGGTGGRAAPN